MDNLPTVAAQPPYAERLRIALDAAKDALSVRGVAKLMAARTGNPVEDERSSLYRYLKTTVPTRQRAELLAQILGDPSLADVEAAAPRRTRLAELEAEVARLSDQHDADLRSVLVRLAAIEEVLGHVARRVDPPSTEGRQR